MTVAYAGSLLGVFLAWLVGPLAALVLLTGAFLLKVTFDPRETS